MPKNEKILGENLVHEAWLIYRSRIFAKLTVLAEIAKKEKVSNKEIRAWAAEANQIHRDFERDLRKLINKTGKTLLKRIEKKK